jgi:hypothetical protein
MKKILFSFTLIFVLISCDDHLNDKLDSSHLTLSRNATGFNTLSGNPDGTGDLFYMQDFNIKGDSAFITVSYPGGCKQHTFELIWSEVYKYSNPPQTDLLVLHNAHGDACEAFITETLSFDLTKLTGTVEYRTVIINIINGKSPSGTLMAEWNPSASHSGQVTFPEGDQCLVEVTAMRVICGAGLYENLYLALNDSVSAGIDGVYFKKYLQPVALGNVSEGFSPVEGRKYLVGARIQHDHPFNEVAICLAYSGPSVPVIITCAAEL